MEAYETASPSGAVATEHTAVEMEHTVEVTAATLFACDGAVVQGVDADGCIIDVASGTLAVVSAAPAAHDGAALIFLSVTAAHESSGAAFSYPLVQQPILQTGHHHWLLPNAPVDDSSASTFVLSLPADAEGAAAELEGLLRQYAEFRVHEGATTADVAADGGTATDDDAAAAASSAAAAAGSAVLKQEVGPMRPAAPAAARFPFSSLCPFEHRLTAG